MNSWLGLGIALVWRGIRHPSTGVALVRVGWRFRSRHWYRHVPFLPIPDREYLRWRVYTAYGDEGLVPSPDDIVRYARWAVSDQ